MRITYKDLDNKLKKVNSFLKFEQEPWSTNKEHKIVANIGTYYIGQAYGGYRIEQITNRGGGCRNISKRGTKKECYNFLEGMLEGILSYIELETEKK
jgi:hypothetical protein